MRFLANENFPRASIILLRNEKHDVFSVAESCSGAKDEDVLSLAHLERHIILTFDQDYGEIIFRRQKTHSSGIVLFRINPAYPEEPAHLLLDLLKVEGLMLETKFSVLDRQQIRIRPLPDYEK